MKIKNTKKQSIYFILKPLVHLVILLMLSQQLWAQAPGGVSQSSLIIWMQADNGVNNLTTPITIANTPVSSWTNRSVISGMTTQASKTPNTNVVVGSSTINYNPSVSFNGASGELLQGQINPTSIPPVGARMSGHLFAVMRRTSNSNGLGGTPYSTTFGPIGTGGGIGIATVNGVDYSLDGSGVIGSAAVSTTLGQTALIEVNYVTDGTIQNGKTSINGKTPVVSTNTAQIFSMDGFFQIGGRTYGGFATRVFRGDVAEIIHYWGPNTYGSGTLLSRIQTYLAVKYSISLPNNYVSSIGTTIYTTTDSYTNNIIGIAREDIEALNQKQSRTNDDTVHVYLNTLAATNSANTGTFGSNISYIMLGDNKGKLCSANTTTADVPATCSVLTRIEREWKVTNTNFAQSFNMDIRLNACAVLGSVTVSHLRLMVDDDGNFANGGTTCYANGDASGLGIAFSNSMVTLTNINNTHIASGATRYIAIGSVNFATPLPVKLSSFNATCGNNGMQVNWRTESELNNLRFDLMRSTNGSEFELVAQIKGHLTSPISHDYSYTDLALPGQNCYYKLIQTDVDLKQTSSEIIIGTCPNTLRSEFSIYPNPSQDEEMKIKYKIASDETITMLVYNALGELVKQEKIHLNANETEQGINVENLPRGFYELILESQQLSRKSLKFLRL